MTTPSMIPIRFTKDFTDPPPIPEAGIAAAMALLRSGQLHRYGSGADAVSEFEAGFAAYTGAAFVTACASGGYAMRLALRALGVGPGDAVLTNAFTLQPVPGAIAALNARPVLVGTTEDLTIDLEDLERASAESGARVLLLSHMRGHIADMGVLMALCARLGLMVVEDCAHTMGALWEGRASGRFGAIGCYSLQSYKHINCGEGGLVVTDDPDLAAKMALMSGAYHFYDRHGAAPDPSLLAQFSPETPNISGRLDRLRAVIGLAQLPLLDARRAHWRELHDHLAQGLGAMGCHLPRRDPRENYVGSSIQFRLPDAEAAEISDFIERLQHRGVALKWFGAPPKGFTSTHRDWGYIPPRRLDQSDDILNHLLDMRLPLSFTRDDIALILQIIGEEISRG